MYNEEIKKECIRLRVEKRLSLKDISNMLEISKSTASLWLKKYPLKEREKIQRYRESGKKSKKPRGVKSKYWDMRRNNLSSS